MLDLATQDASDDAWDELEARAQRFSQGYEHIEVVETRAVWSARQWAEARRARATPAGREHGRQGAERPRRARLQRRLRELG